MDFVRSTCRTLAWLVPAVAYWLSLQATALAVPKEAEEEVKKEGASWVMNYGIVLFGVVLGLLFVLKSSSRRDRAKVDQFAD